MGTTVTSSCRRRLMMIEVCAAGASDECSPETGIEAIKELEEVCFGRIQKIGPFFILP